MNAKTNKEKIEQIVIAKLIEDPNEVHFVSSKLFDNNIAKHILAHLKNKVKEESNMYEATLLAVEAQTDRYKMIDLFDYINGDAVHVENPSYYIKILKDSYFRVKMQELSLKNIELLNNPNADYYPLFEEFELLKNEAESSIDVQVVDLKENVSRSVEDLFSRIEKRKKGVCEYETGWIELDEMIIPEKGHIWTIAARPSVGKTSLVNNICRGYSANNEKGAYFSLEVTALSLSNRFLLAENEKVDAKAFKKGYSSDLDIQRMEESLEKFDNSNIFIIDDKYHIDELCQSIDLLRRKKEITYAVIDFLQIIVSEEKDENVKMTRISQKLKACAKRNKILLIALSQLNRNVENRGSFRHQLSDLRGSGSLEQDSDIITFLHRQAIYDKKDGLEVDWSNQQTRNIELQTLKNKTGEIGDVTLYHNQTITKFYDDKQLQQKNNEAEFGNNDDIDNILNSNENDEF